VLPTLRFLDPKQGHDRHHDGEQAAKKHGAPAERGADRIVQGCRDKEAEIVAGLQVAGAHLAAILRPSFGNVGAGHRPLATHANAREEAEDSLQRSASASKRRFSLPENCRRLAIATTSGSRRGASSEAVSPVALWAPSEAASEEEEDNPFAADFSDEVMVTSYLYSKLPETGVSPHIGTGGGDLRRADAAIRKRAAPDQDA